MESGRTIITNLIFHQLHTVPLTIPVSNWLIFYRGNLILYPKRNENDKITVFNKKKTKKKKQCQKSKGKHKVAVSVK